MRKRLLIALLSIISAGFLLIPINLSAIGGEGVYKAGKGSRVWTHTTTSSATDSAWSYDTLPDSNWINTKGFSTYQFRIHIHSDTNTTLGIGLMDSVRVRFQVERFGVWTQVDSTGGALGAASTVDYTRKWPILIGDTLLGEHFRFVIFTIDTVADTAGVVLHDSVWWWWYLK
ncbi:MAG: hypothetical protein LUO89_05060 [Methanothrix sp.]|nr:hypothetical protein [Methanothrix sp.]